MSAGLAVADELFLVALDDRTGRFRQHSRGVALGLSGALLAELVLAERVSVRAGVLVVVGRRPPADSVAHATLDQVAAEDGRHSLRTWVSFFSRTSVERVGARVERAGLVQRAQARRLGRRELRWPVLNSAEAAAPGYRVRHLLQHERPHDVPQAVLTGLVDAAGLSRDVLAGLSDRTVFYRDFVVSTLPPDLAALVQVTRSLVADTALAHHV